MKAEECAVVFDWNGTVIADTKICWEGTNLSIAQVGAGPVSFQMFRKEYEMPLKAFYIRLGCDPDSLDVKANMDRIFGAFAQHYAVNTHRIRLRRGARSLLQHLQDRGHRSAILSNHVVDVISGVTVKLGVHSFFDEILANSKDEVQDIMHKADKGLRLKRYVEKHGIRRALVVGDSAEEIEIAHRYGFLGVGIDGGFSSAKRIRAANPDFMITSLAQLPEITRKVFGKGAAP